MNISKILRGVGVSLLIASSVLVSADQAMAQKKKKRKKKHKKEAVAKVPTQKEIRNAEMYFTQAEKYFMLEDMAKSFVYFEKSLEFDPNNAAAYFKLAEISIHRKELENAKKYAEKALELDNTNRYYYLINAEVYKKTGELEKAISTYKSLMANVEKTDEFSYELAGLYLYMKKYDEALAELDKVEARFGLNDQVIFQKQKIYIQQGKLDKAVAEGEKLIKAFPDEPRYVLALSEILLSNGKTAEAQKMLTDYLETENSSQVRMLLGQIQQEQGDYVEAKKNIHSAMADPKMSIEAKLPYVVGLFQKMTKEDVKEEAQKLCELLVKVHPEDANARALYGDYYFTLNEKQKAKAAYLKSIEFDDNNLAVWQNIINIDFDEQDMKAAITHSEKALELFPNQAMLYYFSGTAHLMEKNYDKAVNALEQGRKLSGNNEQLATVFYGQLGDAYNGVGENSKSDQAYEDALKIDPNSEHVLNNYAYFLSLRKEKLDEAKQMSEKLVKLHPENGTYLDTYGWVLYQMGDYEGARTNIKKAIDVGEASGAVLEHYGDALFQLGDKEEALKFWEKAKKKGDASEFIDKKIKHQKLYE
ncbi:tetratricopeptide repeat protein [Persicobacter psychrovividus]|uniref:Tetratricopeptide repeat protein n=1 Tax=Persicobacter psychrovividus TaxID=387638 RepID=A0ABN6L4V2_9BACT|nr:hypothetical protein PEPS_02460 [Persicobacter psychrovividus]